MPEDEQFKIYRQLHKLHDKDVATRLHTAEVVLGILHSHFQPGSVLDVGCGRGAWLRSCQRLGITDIRGLEGPWLELTNLLVDPKVVSIRDLEKPFSLGRKYDLLLSLEVAEHLSPSSSSSFVESLTRHSDVILFSAAIPFQPGTGHINTHFLDYWAGIFARYNFLPLDCIRTSIWTDKSIHVWIRQNVVLFLSRDYYENQPWPREIHNPGPLSIIHPELFDALMKAKALDK